MGLHLDIDAIAKKNSENKTGKRKMGFLINENDKMTKEERLAKQKHNFETYGLSKEKIKEIKKLLPPPSEVEIYSLDKILNSKKTLSTIEKIVHLRKLEDALAAKYKKTIEAEQKEQEAKKAQVSKVGTLPVPIIRIQEPIARSSSIEETLAEVPK